MEIEGRTQLSASGNLYCLASGRRSVIRLAHLDATTGVKQLTCSELYRMNKVLENKTVDHKVESSIRSGPVLAEFTIQLTVACYQAARVKEWV